MKQKKTSIKIKHHKYNLYNKKKNKTRQVLTVIITIVSACVLGVVGYGLGKPIMNYLKNREDFTSNPDGAWSPPTSTDSADKSGDPDDANSESPDSSTSDIRQEPQPVEVDNSGIYMLPENAAASSASLTSALAAAKESGCTVVAVTLKDSSGKIYYKTEIEGIKDSESITGTLTAQQICDYITNVGLTPAARISTLMDALSPRLVGGGYLLAGGGGSWLDAAAQNGGKQWLNPFNEDAVKFIGDITSEISSAGFKHIVCTNTKFPVFHTSDISTYLYNLPLTDSDARISALWNVISAAKSGAEKNGAALWLQITGESLLAESRESTDAEISLDSGRFGSERIIVSYSSVGAADKAYESAKEFAQKAKSAANGAEIAILIKSGPSGSALEDAKKAFDEAGLKVFFEN